MIYRILADTVVIFHFLWIVFLIIGGFWGRRNIQIKFLHLSGLGYAIFVQSFNIYCPLTYIETWLRAKHNPSMSYEGSFIAHYLEKLIYIEISREIILLLTVILILFNLFFYLRRQLH